MTTPTDNFKAMAAASSTSAKSLLPESKARLTERVQISLNNVASLARQIQRGSKTSDITMGAAKTFAIQEGHIESTENNLRNMSKLIEKMEGQSKAIEKNATFIEEVKEQCRAMQR